MLPNTRALNTKNIQLRNTCNIPTNILFFYFLDGHKLLYKTILDIQILLAKIY